MKDWLDFGNQTPLFRQKQNAASTNNADVVCPRNLATDCIINQYWRLDDRSQGQGQCFPCIQGVDTSKYTDIRVGKFFDTPSNDSIPNIRRAGFVHTRRAFVKYRLGYHKLIDDRQKDMKVPGACKGN